MKRTVMSLLEKMVVMDKFDRGVRITTIVLWCEWSNVTFYFIKMKMPSREVLRPVFHWRGVHNWILTSSFWMCEDKVLLL
jgi:hypothetical protein